jgi:hypothetical protein
VQGAVSFQLSIAVSLMKHKFQGPISAKAQLIFARLELRVPRNLRPPVTNPVRLSTLTGDGALLYTHARNR